MLYARLFTNSDTLQEVVNVKTSGISVFLEKDSAFIHDDHPNWVQFNETEKEVSFVRKLLCPHRRTLDRHNFPVTLFQRDNYIGIPLALNDSNGMNRELDWLYVYNTVIDGQEGLILQPNANKLAMTVHDNENIILY